MALLVESGKYGAIKKLTHQPMDFMLAYSHQEHIQYRETQKFMEKL